MFFVLQLPIVDLRRFVPADTGLLPKPAWPIPRKGDFVRGFGILCRRILGGIEGWPGEDHYCEADGAIRLAADWKTHLDARFRTLGHVQCAFRRLLADGTAVARVEVAFQLREFDYLRQIEGRDCLLMSRSLLDVPVRIPNRHSVDRKTTHYTTRLVSSTGGLAAHLLHGTTQRQNGVAPQTQAWWVKGCEPLIVVQHLCGQIVKFPRHARDVGFSSPGIELRYMRLQHHQAAMSMWFLGVTPNADQDFARRLRLHLVRLHAELECLREVLRAIAEGRLLLMPQTTACDSLQQYLQDSIRLLSKDSRYGVPQSELLKAVLGSQELVTPGERETLLSATEALLRGNIFRNLKRFTGTPGNTVIHAGPQSRIQVGVNTQFQETIMNDRSIQFGDHAMVTGSNLTVAEHIERSSITIGASGATPDLKQILETVRIAVADMCKHLPPPKADEAARDLDNLIQEVTSPEPRRKWYELSAEGLKEAAKTVGKIAGPVVASLDEMIRLLSGTLGQGS